MADGARVYGPNDLWMLNEMEKLRKQVEVAKAPLAGLGDAAPAKRRLNLSFSDVGDAPDAGLDFTQQPSAPAPKGSKVKAKDVRREFDNLTFWDRMMKTPEWQRGVQGVGEMRAAATERAAKPDTMQRAAEAAEAEAADLDKEAERLRKAGRISEAKAKSDAAYAKRQEAAETALVRARTDEVADARKKASDWIANAKRQKAKTWEDRKGKAKAGGALGGAALGLGIIGNEMMDDWLATENASPENQAANEIINRILLGGETTPEEDALVIEKLGSEDALLRLKESKGAAWSHLACWSHGVPISLLY